MGQSPSKCPCGRLTKDGFYCPRCYDKHYPVCDYCKRPIRAHEATMGNCHQKPCYSRFSGNCCECDAPANAGAYCKSCYETVYPPPVKIHGKYHGMEITFYSREDSRSLMQSLASFHKDRDDAEQQRFYLKDH
ncbi:uncharacterized protein LOC111342487 isoform X2 [Stylophora pistillata]|uniref:Uncharacterized protein n=1 Tax=Stylophora pistillata TaxID=50429 RepID=A0A2B4RHD7_STYPI|nr:uncharacterized protein LOC111342487 isoform X2 [Stylophora pistillata]PFX16219.1 hypothetical protein AWC38_SpisGene19521 [Stylophora pistillata]